MQTGVNDFSIISGIESIEKYEQNNTLHCIFFPIRSNVIHVLSCNLNNAFPELVSNKISVFMNTRFTKFVGIIDVKRRANILTENVAGFIETKKGGCVPFFENTTFFKVGKRKGLVGMTLAETQQVLKMIRISSKYEFIEVEGGFPRL